MAYTFDEIAAHAKDLAIEYVSINPGLVPKLRAAVRSEYDGQMNEQVNALSDEKIVKVVIKHMTAIPGMAIYLNSCRTHCIDWSTFENFWNSYSE